MRQYSKDLKPAFLSLLTTIVAFFVLGILSLWFAVNSTISLIDDIQVNADVIIFNKVGFYFYGVGLGILVFPFSIIYSKLLKLKISNKGESYLNVFLVFSILLMLILPHVAHYYVGAYMKKNDYIICKGKSKRALYTTTIEYSKEGKCRFK